MGPYIYCSIKIDVKPLIVLWILISILFLPFILNSQLAQGKNKYLGNIINNSNDIPSNFNDYWNQVSPENAGKWGSVESTRDNMNWGNLDAIYNYAITRGFKFRQHVLVWGKQQPSWIASLDSAEQAEEVEEWIQLYGERYDQTDYIDVVNEPLYEEYAGDPPPPYLEAMGGAGETGWDWVIWAFEKAREYNPNAELHINQYGILNGWRSMSNYLTIINLLKERDLIDGIALQGHFLESASVNTINSKLSQLAGTELPIHITEYDLDIADDADQLAKYEEQFPVLWEHPSIQGITLWGYIQGKMWRENGYLIRSDGSERPAMEWLANYVMHGTHIDYNRSVPDEFVLHQNHPNPFNPVTKISYNLGEISEVQLEIYNIIGNKIKTLVNRIQSAGSHHVYWNAINESNEYVANGVYVYRIKIKTSNNMYTMSKKMLYIK